MKDINAFDVMAAFSTVAIVGFLIYSFTTSSGEREDRIRALKTIGEQSQYANVFVDAYIECRDKLFAPSHSECLIVGRESTHLRDLTGDSSLVVSQIEKALRK